MLLSDLSKLITVVETVVPINQLHLDSIKDVEVILNKVREAKSTFLKLKSICQPLKSIPIVSKLPLVKELLSTIDRLDEILRSISL